MFLRDLSIFALRGSFWGDPSYTLTKFCKKRGLFRESILACYFAIVSKARSGLEYILLELERVTDQA